MNSISAAGRAGVRTIDRILRRRYGIFAFDESAECVLRLGLGASDKDITLSDGTGICQGEPILELHFWNEHIPPQPPSGVSLRWTIDFLRRADFSLHQLACYLANTPRLDSNRVLHAELGFLELSQFPEARPLVERFGFDFVPGPAPGWRFWKATFWENLFSWWLMWTFNPASLHGKHWSDLARCEFWMSRACLLNKYGGKGNADQAPRPGDNL